MPKNFWRHRPVLVTGANGFIGAELCAALAARGALVTGMVHDPSKHFNKALPLKAKNFHWLRGSVTDLESVKSALRLSGAKTVFHLAANPSPKECEENPPEAFRTNVLGTFNVFEAARAARSRPSVVLASSYYAYAPKKGRFAEGDALGTETIYGTTKAIGEQIAKSYARSFGASVSIARLGAVFGPSASRKETLVPRIILGVESGTRIELNRKAKRRDFVFLGDAVSGFLLLGEKCSEKGVRGEAFNFSNGKPLLPNQVAKTIGGLMGKKARIALRSGAREYDMACDSSKARKVLGWKPMEFREALRETIEWHGKSVGARKAV